MRRIRILAAALGFLSGGIAVAQPNPIGSFQRPQTTNPYPAVSPYLGMFSGGGNAAINYFSIVRPTIEGAQEISQLQQSMYNMQMGGGAGASNANNDMNFGNQTGHPVAFWNYSHYFPMMNRAGGGVGSGLGARGTAQPTFNRGGFAAFNSPQGPQNFQAAPFFVAPTNPSTTK